MAESQWELGWSKEMKRYYFMDKVLGKSSWSRPHGCELDIPQQPPEEKSRPKSPPVPKDLPKGWKAALDRRPEVNRCYYYRAEKPEVRTWYKPLPDQEEEEEEEENVAMEEILQDESAKAKPGAKNFNHGIQLLRSEQSDTFKKKLMEGLLQDVFVANNYLTESSPNITVCLSTQVKISEVTSKGFRANPSPLKPFDQMPEVTFAETTLASAALEFWQQDRKRQICIVSCGSGQMPPTLSFNQETELYCQAPPLLQSLMATTRSPVCPFGPAAHTHSNDLSEMSTVVYTPDCSINRYSISEGFNLLPEGMEFTVPVLSSAAPLKVPPHGLSGDEINKSLSDTLTSVFVAPVIQNPRCTTLILGAWGCEDRFDTDAEKLATKFAELLSGRRTVEGVLIGWLYREVHFCFPKYDAGLGCVKEQHQDTPIEVFKRVFEQHRVNLKLV